MNHPSLVLHWRRPAAFPLAFLTVLSVVVLAAPAVAMPGDDDGAGRLQVAVKNLHVEEGGQVVLAIERSQGSDGEVSVEYATEPIQATPDVDYTDVAGTLTWADGDDAPQEIVVDVLDDDEAEGAEPFRIRIFGATGDATVRPGHDKAQVVIGPSDQPDDEEDDGEDGEDDGEDDEGDDEVDPAAGVLGFDQADYLAAEGAGAAVVTVERTDGSEGAVRVHYAVRKADGTAKPNQDYTNVAGTLEWADGEAGTKTFLVPILDDAVEEPSEFLYVQIRGANGGARLDPDRRDAVLTIEDDDEGEGDGSTDAPGVLRFVAGTFQGAEGDGTATVAVERVQGKQGAVSVAFATADGSAVAGADYLANGGVLAWAAGEMGSKTFAVEIVDDGDTEGNETVNLLLSAPTGAAGLDPAQSVATLTILDDDGDTAVCEEDADTACLLDGRFRVEITYRTSGGASGAAKSQRLTSSSAVFAFFGEDNKEVLFKVLDGCDVPGSDEYWVIFAATTNVGFTARVTDTATGLTKEYTNPAGKNALPVVDTRSFATCQ